MHVTSHRPRKMANIQLLDSHHHQHQGLDPLICSVSRVTAALTVSLVFQLFSFLVVCSDMISKGFGLVASFASVTASSICIHLSCLVCIQSVVHGVRSRLFCGHKGCSLPEVSITISPVIPLEILSWVGCPQDDNGCWIVHGHYCIGKLFLETILHCGSALYGSWAVGEFIGQKN